MLAAIALAALSLLIAAPLALLLLVLWAAVLVVASAGLLEATGGMDPRAFDAVLDLTGVVIAFASGMAFTGKLVEIGQRRSSAVARTSAPCAPWLFRHPFMGLGCALLIVDLVLLPLAYAGIITAPSSIRGAGVIGGAALLLILAACALLGAWWRAMRALWAGARRSPFFAGAVTACGLVAVVSAYFLASAALGLSSALLREGSSPGSAFTAGLRLVEACPAGEPRAPAGGARRPPRPAQRALALAAAHQDGGPADRCAPRSLETAATWSCSATTLHAAIPAPPAQACP
ncbi:hypothetical protein AB3662_25290 [Sorangium cellulosum]|uniref:hypothetical protein n=1 Tax=Sorangium cellulosum TaxID=56 RepID=UPI003D9AAFAB